MAEELLFDPIQQAPPDISPPLAPPAPEVPKPQGRIDFESMTPEAALSKLPAPRLNFEKITPEVALNMPIDLRAPAPTEPALASLYREKLAAAQPTAMAPFGQRGELDIPPEPASGFAGATMRRARTGFPMAAQGLASSVAGLGAMVSGDPAMEQMVGQLAGQRAALARQAQQTGGLPLELVTEVGTQLLPQVAVARGAAALTAAPKLLEIEEGARKGLLGRKAAADAARKVAENATTVARSASLGTVGAQSFGSVYADALNEAYQDPGFPALMSGLAEVAFTAIGGKSGVEAIDALDNFVTGKEFRKFVREEGSNLLKGKLWKTHAGKEALEEGLTQITQDVVERLTYNPELTLTQGAINFGTAAGLGGLFGGMIPAMQKGAAALGNTPLFLEDKDEARKFRAVSQLSADLYARQAFQPEQAQLRATEMPAPAAPTMVNVPEMSPALARVQAREQRTPAPILGELLNPPEIVTPQEALAKPTELAAPPIAPPALITPERVTAARTGILQQLDELGSKNIPTFIEITDPALQRRVQAAIGFKWSEVGNTQLSDALVNFPRANPIIRDNWDLWTTQRDAFLRDTLPAPSMTEAKATAQAIEQTPRVTRARKEVAPLPLMIGGNPVAIPVPAMNRFFTVARPPTRSTFNLYLDNGEVVADYVGKGKPKPESLNLDAVIADLNATKPKYWKAREGSALFTLMKTANKEVAQSDTGQFMLDVGAHLAKKNKKNDPIANAIIFALSGETPSLTFDNAIQILADYSKFSPDGRFADRATYDTPSKMAEDLYRMVKLSLKELLAGNFSMVENPERLPNGKLINLESGPAWVLDQEGSLKSPATIKKALGDAAPDMVLSLILERSDVLHVQSGATLREVTPAPPSETNVAPAAGSIEDLEEQLSLTDNAFERAALQEEIDELRKKQAPPVTQRNIPLPSPAPEPPVTSAVSPPAPPSKPPTSPSNTPVTPSKPTDAARTPPSDDQMQALESFANVVRSARDAAQANKFADPAVVAAFRQASQALKDYANQIGVDPNLALNLSLNSESVQEKARVSIAKGEKAPEVVNALGSIKPEESPFDVVRRAVDEAKPEKTTPTPIDEQIEKLRKNRKTLLDDERRRRHTLGNIAAANVANFDTPVVQALTDTLTFLQKNEIWPLLSNVTIETEVDPTSSQYQAVYIPFKNLIQIFSTAVSEDVGAHEIAHALEGYLPDSIRRQISEARLETIRKIMPTVSEKEQGLLAELHETAPFDEAEFQQIADIYGEDLLARWYHLANTSEYWASQFSNRVGDQIKSERLNPIIRAFRDIWKAIKNFLARTFSKDPQFPKINDIIDQLISGEFNTSPNRGPMMTFGQKLGSLKVPVTSSSFDELIKKKVDVPELAQNVYAANEFVTLLETQNRILNRLTANPRALVARISQEHPDSAKPYELIQSDPDISNVRKDEVTRYAINRMLKFDRDVMKIRTQKELAEEAYAEAFEEDSSKLLQAIKEKTVEKEASLAQVDNIIRDMFDRLHDARKKSTDQGRLAQLAEESKFLKRVSMSKEGVANVLRYISSTLPDDVLNNPKLAPSQILRKVADVAKKTSKETLAQKTGATAESQQMAAELITRYADIQEVLRVLKAVQGETVLESIRKRINELNTEMKASRPKAMAKLVKEAGDHISDYKNATQLLGRLLARKTRIENNYKVFADAVEELDKFYQNPDFRKYRAQVFGDAQYHDVVQTANELRNYAMLPDGEELRWVTTVDLGIDKFNYEKLQEAKTKIMEYLADPGSINYDPRTAQSYARMLEDWNATFLNPSSIEARAFQPGLLDPFKAIRGIATLLQLPIDIPETTALRIGGQAARDYQSSMYAYSQGVERKIPNLYEKFRFEIILAVTDALESHASKDGKPMMYETWADMIEKPLYNSRRESGIRKYNAGDMLNGLKVTKEDIKVMELGKGLEDAVRGIATAGEGSELLKRLAPKIEVKQPESKVKVSGKAATIPAQVGTRRALATSAFTSSRRYDSDGRDIVKNWIDAPDIDRGMVKLSDAPEDRKGAIWSQLDLLEDPKNFYVVFASHVRAVGQHDYAIKSPFEPIYDHLIKEIDDGSIRNIEDSVQFILENLDMLGEVDSIPWQTDEDIYLQIYKELNTGISKLAKIKAEEAISPKDLGKAETNKSVVAFLSSDNSFTQERGMLIGPPGLYDYGFSSDYKMRNLINSARKPYLANMLDKMDNLIDALESYEKKFTNTSAKELREKVQKGEAYIDVTRAKMIRKELIFQRKALYERFIYNKTRGVDPVQEDMMNTLMGIPPVQVLANVSPTITNYVGAMGGSFFGQQLVGDTYANAARMTGKFIAEPFKRIPYFLGKPFEKYWNKLGGSKITRALQQYFTDTRDLYREMEQYGTVPRVDMKNAWLAYRRNAIRGGRPPSIEDELKGRKGKVAGMITSRADMFLSRPFRRVAPRISDRMANSVIIQRAQQDEDRLKLAALRLMPIQEELATKNGYDFNDDTLLENRITSKDWSGNKTHQKEALFLETRLFRAGVENPRKLLREFYKKYKAAGENPDLDSIPLFDETLRKDYEVSLLNETNLPALFMNPLALNKGPTSRLLSTFFRFPLFQADMWTRLLGKVSTDSTAAKYLPSIIGVATFIALANSLGQLMKNWWREVLPWETRSGLPDWRNVTTTKEGLNQLTLGLFAQLPFFAWAGKMIGSQQPNRWGFDINSQFIMMNFATDVLQTFIKSVQAGPWYPWTDFTKRWFPATKTILNQLPSTIGLKEIQSSQNDLRSAMPEGIGASKRGGGDQFNVSSIYGEMRAMVNAMGKGDRDEFMVHYQNALDIKTEEWKEAHPNKPFDEKAQKAVAESVESNWAMQNPWFKVMGRKPTEGERETVLSRLSADKRAIAEGIDQKYEQFSGLIGANESVVKGESGGGGGAGMLALGAGTRSTASPIGLPYGRSRRMGRVPLPAAVGGYGSGGYSFGRSSLSRKIRRPKFRRLIRRGRKPRGLLRRRRRRGIRLPKLS